MLVGKRLQRESFYINEEPYDASAIQDIFADKAIGVRFPGALSIEDCNAIIASFMASPGRYTRDPSVPADYLGAFHYGKILSTYLDEAESSRLLLSDLFKNARNPQKEFLDKFLLDAGNDASIRLASYGDREACPFVIRSWSDTGDYSLKPHEDESQCEDPRQRGFEIQGAAANGLISVNICLHNTGGGDLHIWNIQPDKACKRALGLEYTGYPYRPQDLEEIDHIETSIKTGDIYCFNSKYIHAVGPTVGLDPRRITLAFMIGRKHAENFVYWA